MVRAFDNRFFRGALGRFTTGVIVLSTGPRRAPHAMTANARHLTESRIIQ